MNIEHKIEQFSNAIFKEAESERDIILNGISKIYKKSLVEIKKKALDKSRDRIEEEKNRLEREGNRTVLNINAEVRKKVIAKRDDLINSVFDAVEQKLRDFKSSDSYKDWLLKIVSSEKGLFGGEKFTVYLVKEDMKYATEIADKTGGSVVESPIDFVGGCRLVCESRSIAVDKTILSGLTEQKASFSKLKVS